jgi:hypothetical protein
MRVSRREKIGSTQSTLGQSGDIPTNAGLNVVVRTPVAYSGSPDCESRLGRSLS